MDVLSTFYEECTEHVETGQLFYTLNFHKPQSENALEF
jgi:hypothetical protein